MLNMMHFHQIFKIFYLNIGRQREGDEERKEVAVGTRGIIEDQGRGACGAGGVLTLSARHQGFRAAVVLGASFMLSCCVGSGHMCAYSVST